MVAGQVEVVNTADDQASQAKEEVYFER